MTPGKHRRINWQGWDKEKSGTRNWSIPVTSRGPPPTPIQGQEFSESSSAPPSSFSSFALPGRQGQEPPNYFQMWTSHEAVRGEGAER